MLVLFFDATSSEKWGSNSYEIGKYPTKIYTIDGVLIYQQDEGRDNTAKVPKGGVVIQSSPASSMLDAIANPITFYGGSPYTVVNQEGHSGDLYNYYWTSYSRGTDGRANWSIKEPNWHNVYLDGYIPLRVKSIYDPCPYLYRLPSNGTYNQFRSDQGWTQNSYLGGVSWNMNTLSINWFSSLGSRNSSNCDIIDVGRVGFYYLGIVCNKTNVYSFWFGENGRIYSNRNDLTRSYGSSVRCIENSQRQKSGSDHSNPLSKLITDSNNC